MNSTKGEIRLWCELLRGRRMNGYQFFRQYAIENYVVDFMCRKLNLIIEVDGYSHNFKYEKDIFRDKKLGKMGYNVLRFSETEVKNDLFNVERTILYWMEEKEKELLSGKMKTSPVPPSEEGGH
jgi:very-short-patch-repair endonuclease